MSNNNWQRSDNLIYLLNEKGMNKIWATFYGVPGTTSQREVEQAAELARKAPQLLEGCKKALSCASLPDSVREVIKQAIAGTLLID